MNELVTVSNDKVTTTSQLVAEKFGKRHDNVLQTINALCKVQPEFAALNFQVMQLFNDLPNGGRQPVKYYEMTQAGFTILAMGFTGEKALQFKVDYINAFEMMRGMLSAKRSRQPKIERPIPSLLQYRHELIRPLVNQHSVLMELVDLGILDVSIKTIKKYKYEVTEYGADLGYSQNVNGTVIEPQND